MRRTKTVVGDRVPGDIEWLVSSEVTEQRVIGCSIAIVSGLAFWPTSVNAHESTEMDVHLSVGFGVAVAISIFLSLFGGVVITSYRSKNYSDLVARQCIPVILLALGVFAIILSFNEHIGYTVTGVMIGGAIAWAVHDQTVTGCGSCSDTTLGAILTHRLVEGIVIAGVYATNATLGIMSIIVLTAHAVAETAVIGELYATAGRLWSFASMVSVQVGFLLGIIFGTYTVSVLPVAVTVTVFAGFGGTVLLVAMMSIQEINTNHDSNILN